MPGLEDRLGEVTVNNAELAFDERVAGSVGVDDGCLQEARTGQDRPQVALREATPLCVAAVYHEELVAPGGDAALDAEEVSQRRTVPVAGRAPIVLGVAGVHGPLPGLAQFVYRDGIARMRLADRAPEGELDCVPGRGTHLAEYEDYRRYQGITELNIFGCEAVSADQRNAVREVSLESSAVVDVHELRGDEPCGVAAFLHPGSGEKEEVNVQARKAADLDAGHSVRERLQALLVLALQVMVPDVGWVGKDQVRRDRASSACDDTCKVAQHQIKTRLRPQVASGSAEAGIEFNANRALDPLLAEYPQRG